MASLRFTKEQIEVAAKEIKRYADEILESLKAEDVFDTLEGVNRNAGKIEDRLEDIAFRLADCDEF